MKLAFDLSIIRVMACAVYKTETFFSKRQAILGVTPNNLDIIRSYSLFLYLTCFILRRMKYPP